MSAGNMVALCFGEWICSIVFDRILGCNGEKRIGEPVFLPLNGNLAFVHRFQQRRLGSRGRAVDLVGKQQIGEDRTLTEGKRSLLRGINGGSENIRREQIGRELYAAEFGGNGARESFCKRGFPCTGNVFHENMPAGKESGQQQFNRLFFSPYDGIQLFPAFLDIVMKLSSLDRAIYCFAFFSKYNLSSRECQTGGGNILRFRKFPERHGQPFREPENRFICKRISAF